MNDSGFWIFSRMSGLTQAETLRTWTVTLTAIAVFGLIELLIISSILPFAG
jgi:GntP family gluconate:H+ symporter